MRTRTEAKREAILETASRLLIEFGYARTSMDLIAQTVGGSKSTLYGYFRSKDELFVEVTRYLGERHLSGAVAELSSNPDDVAGALCRFGEKYLVFVSADFAVATRRMVIAESGHSDIGQRFFETGPQRSIRGLAAFLKTAMDAGRLRPIDVRVATSQFVALLEAECMLLLMLGFPLAVNPTTCRDQAARAVATFMAAYGTSPAPSGPA